MSLTLQTISAEIDENGVLHGLQKLEALRSQIVQVVVVTNGEADYDDFNLTPAQWHRGISNLMAETFVDDPEEDIYSREDGKPYDATQD